MVVLWAHSRANYSFIGAGGYSEDVSQRSITGTYVGGIKRCLTSDPQQIAFTPYQIRNKSGCASDNHSVCFPFWSCFRSALASLSLEMAIKDSLFAAESHYKREHLQENPMSHSTHDNKFIWMSFYFPFSRLSYNSGASRCSFRVKVINFT